MSASSFALEVISDGSPGGGKRPPLGGGACRLQGTASLAPLYCTVLSLYRTVVAGPGRPTETMQPPCRWGSDPRRWVGGTGGGFLGGQYSTKVHKV